MKTKKNGYEGYRYPREIVSHGVWLYHRFSLNFRDVEEMLAKRGIVVTYETIRQWCRKFGPEYARKLKRRIRHSLKFPRFGGHEVKMEWSSHGFVDT